MGPSIGDVGRGRGDGWLPGPAAYSIKVKRGGEVLKVYDLAALQALPQHAVVIDGKEQGGPLLATVLADAGAAQYDKVVVAAPASVTAVGSS